MRMFTRQWVCALLALILLQSLALTSQVRAQSAVQESYIGMWISAGELAALPTTGTAWTALRKAADASTSAPNIANQDSNNDVYVLAKALVFARTGETKYRDQVIANLKAAIGTEKGGRTLALGRNLVSYVIAADLVNLPAVDPAFDSTFRAWLKTVRTATLDEKTLISTHEERPNNWGTHAGASRVAVALYLQDTADLKRAAEVFEGWTGDRESYAGFEYGALFWQCTPGEPVGVNPPGCMIDGHDVGGSLPEEMRRAGGKFTWPAAETGYAWEAMQGAVVQAMLLHRAGYDAFAWGDQAILRAAEFLYSIGWKPEGDDLWQVWLINAAYGTRFETASPAGQGKNMGWTDWTHGSGSGPAPSATRTSIPTTAVPTTTATLPPRLPTATATPTEIVVVPSVVPPDEPLYLICQPIDQPPIVAQRASQLSIEEDREPVLDDWRAVIVGILVGIALTILALRIFGAYLQRQAARNNQQ